MPGKNGGKMRKPLWLAHLFFLWNGWQDNNQLQNHILIVGTHFPFKQKDPMETSVIKLIQICMIGHQNLRAGSISGENSGGMGARFGRFDVLTLPETNQNCLWKFKPKLTSKEKKSHFPQMLIFFRSFGYGYYISIFHSVHLATWLCYQRISPLTSPKQKTGKTWQGKWPRICVMKNWWLGPDSLHMFHLLTTPRQNDHHQKQGSLTRPF